MEQTRLGNTNLTVSRLGLGGLFAARPTEDASPGTALVGRANELGVSMVDTAPSYGSSEEMLGRILADTGRPAVLSTKVGAGGDRFDPHDPDEILRSIERSLKLLGTDYLDIVMVHEPDRPGHYDWWSDMYRVEGPVLDVLTRLREEGVIGAIGLGGTGVTELAHLVRSGRFDVVLTAFNYSLLYREAEELVIAAAHEIGVGVIAGSPLQQGGDLRYAALRLTTNVCTGCIRTDDNSSATCTLSVMICRRLLPIWRFGSWLRTPTLMLVSWEPRAWLNSNRTYDPLRLAPCKVMCSKRSTVSQPVCRSAYSGSLARSASGSRCRRSTRAPGPLWRRYGSEEES